MIETRYHNASNDELVEALHMAANADSYEAIRDLLVEAALRIALDPSVTHERIVRGAVPADLDIYELV